MMTIKFTFTSLLALVLPGYGRADWITPTETQVLGVEGKAGDLFCHYGTSSSGYIDLYWFRQYPNQAPEFILYRGWGYSGKGDADFAKKKFYSKVTANSTNLYISSLVPADTALYYCALRKIGGIPSTDPLIFGRGTKLIVEPKTQPPSSPSVFVMKNGTNVACLVKDFYPKDVNISLQSSKKIKEIGSAIVISPSKKYSAVKLGQYEGSSSVTCSVQHNNKIVNSTDFEPNTNLSDNPKPTEAGSVTQATQSYREPKVYAEKVNMMSLTVLGLRMLFAKSVAINFLLTAKLFFS